MFCSKHHCASTVSHEPHGCRLLDVFHQTWFWKHIYLHKNGTIIFHRGHHSTHFADVVAIMALATMVFKWLCCNICFFPHHVTPAIANIMSDQMDNIWRGKVSLRLMFNHVTHYLEQTRASPGLTLCEVLVMKCCLDTRSDAVLSWPSEEASHIWPLLYVLQKPTWSKPTASHYHLLSLFFHCSCLSTPERTNRKLLVCRKELKTQCRSRNVCLCKILRYHIQQVNVYGHLSHFVKPIIVYLLSSANFAQMSFTTYAVFIVDAFLCNDYWIIHLICNCSKSFLCFISSTIH